MIYCPPESDFISKKFLYAQIETFHGKNVIAIRCSFHSARVFCEKHFQGKFIIVFAGENVSESRNVVTRNRLKRRQHKFSFSLYQSSFQYRFQ
jgi:hypothetical protein